MHGDKDLLELAEAFAEAFFIAGEAGEDGHLQPVGDGMVVLRRGFLAAVLAGEHPVEVIGKPFPHAGRDFRREGGRFLQRGDGHGDFDQVKRVDDADAAAGRNSGDGLGVVQVRIHPRLGIEKEHAEERGGFARVAFPAGDLIGGGQCGDGLIQLAHGHPVLAEISRIALAVALDVRQAVGRRGIGPPVVAVRVEVVRSAIAESGAGIGDTEWLQFERCGGGLEDAGAVESGDVDGSRAGGNEQVRAVRRVGIERGQGGGILLILIDGGRLHEDFSQIARIDGFDLWVGPLFSRIRDIGEEEIQCFGNAPAVLSLIVPKIHPGVFRESGEGE